MDSEKKEPNGRGRSIRIPDPIWNTAQDKAAREGTNIAAVIRKRLEKYVADDHKVSAPGVGVMRSMEGSTPSRSIYVTNDLWEQANDKASRVRETLTAVIISSLIRYITGR